MTRTAEYPRSLVGAFALLSDALADPITDLQAVLSVLTDDLYAAVPQFLGLTVTLHVDENPVILNTLSAGGSVEVRASLLLPLPLLPLDKSAAHGGVIFYSGSAGAFIDLAEDARSRFGATRPPVLDGHLPSVAARADPVGIRGLTELRDYNQAVGVLIADTHDQRQADTELRRRAVGGQHTVLDAARQLLGSIGQP